MTATTAASAAAGASPASARPWLASYPPGVPARSTKRRCHARRPVPRQRAATRSARARKLRQAHHLRRARDGGGRRRVLAPGARPAAGDRVAIMLPNVMAYPAILLGVLTAGCTVVNVNPLYTPRELVPSAARRRRPHPLRARKFRPHGRGGAAGARARQGRGRHARRPHGPQGHDREPRLAAREEGGEAIPGCRASIPFKTVLAEGRKSRRSRSPSGSMTSPSCNTPAAPPASPRARR